MTVQPAFRRIRSPAPRWATRIPVDGSRGDHVCRPGFVTNFGLQACSGGVSWSKSDPRLRFLLLPNWGCRAAPQKRLRFRCSKKLLRANGERSGPVSRFPAEMEQHIEVFPKNDVMGTAASRVIPRVRLLNRSGFKVAYRAILYRVAHLDRMAANLAVFHIDLAFHRGIQHHRYLRPAVWAREEMLHSAQDT